MNLGMYLARSARFWPNRPAVLYRDGALTYRELELRSNRLAHALKALGLKRGDRVAVVSPNRPEIVELECALYKAGLVKVALNSRLAPQELKDALENAEPIACLAGPEHRAMVDEASAGVPTLQHRIAFDPTPTGNEGGWLSYEALLAAAPDTHWHEDMQAEELALSLIHI